MSKTMQTQPDYIFETSWEVCNKVGGIYAVLSTRAASMQKEHPNQVIFFGPDFYEHSDIDFKEDKSLLKDWQKSLKKDSPLRFRIGRWLVPGEPIAILIKWDYLWAEKDAIYAWAWNKYGVQSHAAYGDYDESCLFSYAVGQCMSSIASFLYREDPETQIVAHANEWQTAFMLFYLEDYCPQVGTLFTTHATSIGRSIAGNGKPLYDYFEGYNGDQMAGELNMVSKHSVEKMAARYADCFTTVSDLTAKECKQLLDKEVDIVTPNGFEPTYVPKGKAFDALRVKTRQALTQAAEAVLGGKVPQNSLYIGIAGRQEWKNKGIDVFMDSLLRLGQKISEQKPDFNGDVIAFVMVPYLDKPVLRIGRVSAVFVPYYLKGNPFPADSPIKALESFRYYELLTGLDLTVFPSYYEPWGYTPLESLAFHVPTITTDKAGFGLWAANKGFSTIDKGVAVIARTDSNYHDVVENVAQTIYAYLLMDTAQKTAARKAAVSIAKKADWQSFFQYYRKAYTIALTNSQSRGKASASNGRSKK